MRPHDPRGRDHLLAVSAGADIDPVTGALLSITELQAKLRGLSRSDRAGGTPGRTAVRPSPAYPGGIAQLVSIGSDTGAAADGTDPTWSRPSDRPIWPDLDGVKANPAEPADPSPERRRWQRGEAAWTGCEWPDWATSCPVVAVSAASPGSGCSTFAVALADAAASLGRTTVLLDDHEPSRSGLVAAADAELGLLGDGSWRHGRRGQVVILRRAVPGSSAAPAPPQLPPGTAPLLVADLGSDQHCPGQPAAADIVLVLTARVTIPGMQSLERRLAALPTGLVVFPAVLGPRRWPRPVRAACGRRVRELESSGRLIRIPTHGQLQTFGLTADRLPRVVEAAAGRLLAAVMNA